LRELAESAASGEPFPLVLLDGHMPDTDASRWPNKSANARTAQFDNDDAHLRQPVGRYRSLP